MQNGHLIEASTLKISAFLNNLILGRGFGSVFRRQATGIGKLPRLAAPPPDLPGLAARPSLFLTG